MAQQLDLSGLLGAFGQLAQTNRDNADRRRAEQERRAGQLGSLAGLAVGGTLLASGVGAPYAGLGAAAASGVVRGTSGGQAMSAPEIANLGMQAYGVQKERAQAPVNRALLAPARGALEQRLAETDRQILAYQGQQDERTFDPKNDPNFQAGQQARAQTAAQLDALRGMESNAGMLSPQLLHGLLNPTPIQVDARAGLLQPPTLFGGAGSQGKPGPGGTTMLQEPAKWGVLDPSRFGLPTAQGEEWGGYTREGALVAPPTKLEKLQPTSTMSDALTVARNEAKARGLDLSRPEVQASVEGFASGLIARKMSQPVSTINPNTGLQETRPGVAVKQYADEYWGPINKAAPAAPGRKVAPEAAQPTPVRPPVPVKEAETLEQSIRMLKEVENYSFKDTGPIRGRLNEAVNSFFDKPVLGLGTEASKRNEMISKSMLMLTKSIFPGNVSNYEEQRVIGMVPNPKNTPAVNFVQAQFWRSNMRDAITNSLVREMQAGRQLTPAMQEAATLFGLDPQVVVAGGKTVEVDMRPGSARAPYPPREKAKVKPGDFYLDDDGSMKQRPK